MSDWTGYAAVAFFLGLAVFLIIKRCGEKREPLNRKQKKIVLGMVVAMMLVIAACVSLVYLKIVDTLPIIGIIAAILIINVVGMLLTMRAK